MRSSPISIIAIIILFFENCSSVGIHGRYTNVFAEVAGEELRITENPNRFAYYSRTEGSIREYSEGTWTRSQKTIFLNGFNDNNIKTLHVESKIEDSPEGNTNKIIVRFTNLPMDTFTKVDIVINENLKLPLSGDTTLLIQTGVKRLQLKSYLSYNGFLFPAPPKLDTLYSKKIVIDDISNKPKIILLKFGVPLEAFYRVKLIDTVTIRNNSKIIWHKRQLKKIKE